MACATLFYGRRCRELFEAGRQAPAAKRHVDAARGLLYASSAARRRREGAAGTRAGTAVARRKAGTPRWHRAPAALDAAGRRAAAGRVRAGRGSRPSVARGGGARARGAGMRRRRRTTPFFLLPCRLPPTKAAVAALGAGRRRRGSSSSSSDDELVVGRRRGADELATALHEQDRRGVGVVLHVTRGLTGWGKGVRRQHGEQVHCDHDQERRDAQQSCEQSATPTTFPFPSGFFVKQQQNPMPGPADAPELAEPAAE